MKSITFINPPLSGEADFSAKQTTIPPEGLCLLAACTRNAGYKTSIIDSAALGYNNQDIVGQIEKDKPDFIGITSTTPTIHNCAELAKIIRKKLPESTIIIGGPHITVEGEETMKFFGDSFDIAVAGEAEETIIELLDALVNEKSLKDINGLLYYDKGKLMIANKREVVSNLDSLPLPAWDLLPDITKYYQQSIARADRFPSMSLMTSRGCPGQCIYCASNKKLRAYSTEKLIKIVKHLIDNYGIKSLEINDDNFVVFKKRLEEFCNIIIKENIDITWSCFSRVNNIDSTLLNLMTRAGCKRIAFGIESGSQKILDFERKWITIKQIRKAVEMTHKAGIKVTGYFIIGHPLETKSSMQRTIDFAKSMPLDDFLVSYMVPYPGTYLYHIADKYGSFDKDWKKMYQWDVTFIPKGLTKTDLEYYFKKGFREFYFRPRIIYNYTKRLLNPKYTYRFLKGGLIAFWFLLRGR